MGLNDVDRRHVPTSTRVGVRTSFDARSSDCLATRPLRGVEKSNELPHVETDWSASPAMHSESPGEAAKGASTLRVDFETAAQRLRN